MIEGYVTAEDAESKYGVMVTYNGKADDLVKLPEKWVIDQMRTTELRSGRSDEPSENSRIRSSRSLP